MSAHLTRFGNCNSGPLEYVHPDNMQLYWRLNMSLDPLKNHLRPLDNHGHGSVDNFTHMFLLVSW